MSEGQGFIPVDLSDDDTTEPGTHPEAVVDLRCFSAEFKTAKDSGRPMALLCVEIEAGDGEEYAPIFHNILFPSKEELQGVEEEDKQSIQNVKRWKRDIVKICTVFGVPYEGGFTENTLNDFNGASGRCQIGLGEFRGETNNVLKLPRLPKKS